MKKNKKDNFVNATPDHIAKAIVERYKPTGRILDPCAGDGAFPRHIPDCLWCEIKEGKDFFDWHESVDWIIGNPPFSILNSWLEHSFLFANDIVYLLPLAQIVANRKRLLMINNYGGIVEIYAPWTGRAVGFDNNWVCGAVHLRKGYTGPLTLIV